MRSSVETTGIQLCFRRDGTYYDENILSRHELEGISMKLQFTGAFSRNLRLVPKLWIVFHRHSKGQY